MTPRKPDAGTQWISRNKYSGEELGRAPAATREELRSALERAADRFAKWRRSSAFERSGLLLGAASKLRGRQEEFAGLISDEAGKPITLARAEVSRALGVLEWAAGEAQRFSGELLRLDAGANGREGFGIHQRFARGVVLGITPFNFPLNLVVHKIAPAIACGSPILIKPSPRTPLTALRLAELFSDVPALVQVVLADDALTSELTGAPEVRTVSFTGSARVGWEIRRQCPEKPVVLELGGNAWVIVLEDTPSELLPAIAKRVAGAGYGYAGQSCISIQNIAVAAPRFEEFRARLEEATLKTPFGDPRQETVVTGPLIDAAAKARVEKVLASSGLARVSAADRSTHASVLAPTLLSAEHLDGYPSLPPVMGEEIFAPVMTLGKFDQIGKLIRLINSSRYGLQAGVFTQNLPAIQELYRELEVGGLVVNDVPTTRYDHQPYGGVKDSGFGREGVRYAMDEMTESKFLALSSTLPL